LIGVVVPGDGRTNWFKGVQLNTVYVLMAMLFYSCRMRPCSPRLN